MKNRESQIKQLSAEIESIRTLLNMKVQQLEQLSDPQIYDISVKLDRKIMEYEEIINGGFDKVGLLKERSGYGQKV